MKHPTKHSVVHWVMNWPFIHCSAEEFGVSSPFQYIGGFAIYVELKALLPAFHCQNEVKNPEIFELISRAVKWCTLVSHPLKYGNVTQRRFDFFCTGADGLTHFIQWTTVSQTLATASRENSTRKKERQEKPDSGCCRKPLHRMTAGQPIHLHADNSWTLGNWEGRTGEIFETCAKHPNMVNILDLHWCGGKKLKILCVWTEKKLCNYRLTLPYA